MKPCPTQRACPRARITALVLSLACLGGCVQARFETPTRFVKLADEDAFEQRATSTDGVVIAIRKIRLDEPGSLAFWADAISQRLTGSQGYALLERVDARAKSGQAGTLLRMGRDQNGQTFDYWVAVFPHKKRLYLVEAGGRRDRFEKARPEVERALASVTLR